MLFSNRKLECNSFESVSFDCCPVFVLVLSYLSLQLRLRDFVGFQISTEAVAICCFSTLQTAGGFHDVTKRKSLPGLACQPAFT